MIWLFETVKSRAPRTRRPPRCDGRLPKGATEALGSVSALVLLEPRCAWCSASAASRREAGIFMLTVSQLLALPCLLPRFSPHIADRSCSGFSERSLAAVGATPVVSRGVCLVLSATSLGEYRVRWRTRFLDGRWVTGNAIWTRFVLPTTADSLVRPLQICVG